jgi:prepilin-type processing-associated H-X9-DG protein
MDYAGSSRSAYTGRVAQRHFEGANIAYVDGHVKFVNFPGPVTQDDTLWTRH